MRNDNSHTAAIISSLVNRRCRHLSESPSGVQPCTVSGRGARVDPFRPADQVRRICAVDGGVDSRAIAGARVLRCASGRCVCSHATWSAARARALVR